MAQQPAKKGRRSTPRKYRSKQRLRINDAGFLLDTNDAESYTLNASGIVIFRALMAGVDSSRLARELAASFEVTEEQAQRDVDRFLLHLATLGLVEPVGRKDHG